MNWNLFIYGLLILSIVLNGYTIHNILKLRAMISEQLKKIKELRIEETRLKLLNLRASYSSQEAERRRISMILHDEIGSSLSTLKVRTETLYRKIEDLRGVSIIFNDLFDIISQVIKRSKTIVHDLSPDHLLQFGVSSAIRQSCMRLNDSSTIRAHFEVKGLQHETRLSEERQLLLYRAAQELINNSIKYSNAWAVHVNFLFEEKEIVLSIKDNGLGVKEYRPISGSGLRNIQNRVSLLGGTFNYQLNKGASYFTLKLPYNHAF